MRRRAVFGLVARGSMLVLAYPLLGSAPANAAIDRNTLTLSAGVFGSSREERALVDFDPGTVPRTVLVVGGIHAGTEANTVTLVEELMSEVQQDPGFLPPGLGMAFIAAANPDGLANGSRMLASGVDPNRNWPTDDWTTDSYVAGPTRVTGGGGPSPLSEPETQALAAFVTRLRPALLVSYHSAAGLVTGGARARVMGLESAYADAASYAAGDWTAYPVTGDFAKWAEERQGVPTIEVELPDHENTDLERNIAGLRAAVWRLAAGPN